MPYNPGDVLKDRYIIEEVLGKGSMGEVYRAKHVTINRQFAIKLMHVHIAEKAESLARFRREANAAAQLDHPHICQVTDFDSTENGDFYLVMEYLKGEMLRDRLDREGTIEIKSIFRIMNDLLSALECAHESGIVHRDVKPENILLIKRDDRDDYVKLIDFGIAHAEIKTDNEGTLTQSGQVYGTPQYLSPEQVMGEPVDSRADLYSCGCLLYEMLMGHPPFDADNYVLLLNKHLILAPPHLSVELECAQELDEVIQRLMMKHPEERFSSAHEVRSVLSDIANRFDSTLNIRMSQPGGNTPSLEAKQHSTPKQKPFSGENKGRTTISNPYIAPDDVSLLQKSNNIMSSANGDAQKSDETSSGDAKKKTKIKVAAIVSGIVLVLLATALICMFLNQEGSDEDSEEQSSDASGDMLSNEVLAKYAKSVCPIPEYSPLYQDEKMQNAANKCVNGEFDAAYKSLDKLKNDYHESSRFTMMMMFNAYALKKDPVVVRNALSLINIDPGVFCHDAARDIMYSLIESDSTFESLQNGISYLNPARASEALSWLLLLTPCNQYKKRFQRISKVLDSIEDDPEESGWLEAAAIMWRPYKPKGTCTGKQKRIDDIIYDSLEKECSQLGDNAKHRGRCSLCLNIWKNRKGVVDSPNAAGSMPE